MKKNNNLQELMGYAGGHRYLTYLSLLLSAVSAILALFPFVFLFRIIQEVIAVAPNYAQATHIVRNGWMAVGFALGRSAGGHLQPTALILRPQLLRGDPARIICVQAQHHMAQVGIVPQVGVQPSLIEPTQGHSVGSHLPMEGAEAHQVDGGFEYQHPGDGRIAGDGKGDAFVAAQHIPFEADAVLVVGTSFAGEPGLAGVVSPHEHAVVVFLVLIDQTGIEEGPDHLGGQCHACAGRRTPGGCPHWPEAGRTRAFPPPRGVAWGGWVWENPSPAR